MELKKLLIGLEGLKVKGNLDLDINGIETPSALSILLKNKDLIKLLKDENNMLQLEKLFNALIC